MKLLYLSFAKVSLTKSNNKYESPVYVGAVTFGVVVVFKSFFAAETLSIVMFFVPSVINELLYLKSELFTLQETNVAKLAAFT